MHVDKKKEKILQWYSQQQILFKCQQSKPVCQSVFGKYKELYDYLNNPCYKINSRC